MYLTCAVNEKSAGYMGLQSSQKLVLTSAANENHFAN